MATHSNAGLGSDRNAYGSISEQGRILRGSIFSWHDREWTVSRCRLLSIHVVGSTNFAAQFELFFNFLIGTNVMSSTIESHYFLVLLPWLGHLAAFLLTYDPIFCFYIIRKTDKAF